MANNKDLLEAFGTTDKGVICAEILQHGEMQVSEKERSAQIDLLVRDIAQIVAEKSVNPENSRPYTVSPFSSIIFQYRLDSYEFLTTHFICYV